MLLSANAGSGKTAVLTERFVRAVVEDGLSPGALLAITFTEKAAGELRARLRARLAELGERDAARAMDGAWVSTIHGFCARVLRTHAAAAGLDPRFTVLDESQARALRTQAWDAAMADFLADGEDGRARTEALELVARYRPDRLCDEVQRVHDTLRARGASAPALPAPRPRGDRGAALRSLREATDAVAAELAGVTRSLKSLDDARAVVAQAAVLAAGDDPDPAAVEALKLARACAELKTDACDAFRAAVETAAGVLHDERAVADWALLDELLRGYAARYAEAKGERSALDFDDLELGLHDLLTRDAALAEHYAQRFERVMVDEFQDTNPLQLAILARLRADTVFVVGDELQSIYGFRHADVEVFRDRRAVHDAAGTAATLSVNWRSEPEVLHTINGWLGRLHDRYAPLVPGREASSAGAPRTELLVVDAVWDDDEAVPPALAEQVSAGLPLGRRSRDAEARAVARRVREVLDEDGREPGDVAVLLRAASDIERFERALELEGLPTLSSGGRGFWGREQVQDLTSYLAVLANPRDELALYATLASPLCGMGPDGLVVLADGREPAAVVRGDAAPPAALPPGDAARLARFSALLAAERAAAPRRRLDELIARAVRATGYDLHVLRLAGGPRRLANVHKLERLAAAFEAARGRDLRGFIDHARAELEADAREPDAPIDPGERSAVALMTIHAAKGLQFPVVVVADLGRQRSGDLPRILVQGERGGLRMPRADGDAVAALEYVDLRDVATAREQAEEHRILHVAATRAEERLLLSGVAKLGPDTRWPSVTTRSAPLAALGAALDPELPTKLAQHAELLVDEDRAGQRVRVRVRRVAPGDADAVLGLAEVAGQTALTLDGGATGAVAEERARLAQVPPAAAAAAPGAGQVPAVTPTALSYSQLAGYERCGYRHYLERVLGLPPVEEDLAPPAAAPIAGMDPRVRGSIVHDVLERLDLADPRPPSDEQLDRLAARHGHGAELGDAARADLQTLVATFGEGPWRARVLAAGAVAREAVFAYPLGPVMVNGVVDLRAVEADGTALVLDYKTDRLAPEDDPAAVVERSYGVQRRIYALAELRAGAPAVEVVHLFLERPDEPAVARYAAADAARLEEELRARVAALLAGEFPVAPDPHAALCHGCPGRGTLCRHPRELTERAVPAPVAPPAVG